MKINYKRFFHFFTLSFGSLLSLIINTLVLVVFSRIYTKEHFGNLAIFVSVVSLLAILSTFRLEHLIVLKTTNKEAGYLSKICKKIITYFFILISLFSFLFYIFSISFFGLPCVLWIFIPIPIYSLSHIIVFLSWNNKIKNYKLISNYKVLQSLTVGLSGLFFNFLYKDYGLIISYILGVFFSFLFFDFSFKKFIKKFDFKGVSFQTVKETFLINKKYLKNSFGLEFFNTISKYMPNFILSVFYGNGIVGIYDMTLKVLHIPKNIISLNIGELYYQKASIFAIKSRRKFSKLTMDNIYTLLGIGILCYLPFIFFGKALFVFVLGDEWELSGLLSEKVALWFLFLFISSPMSYIFYIKKTLSVLFLFITIAFVIKGSTLYYLSNINYPELETLFVYTYLCVILEIVLILLIIREKNKF